MVCFASASVGGCGMGNADVPAGTWAVFSHQFSASDLSSGVGAGGMFSSATLARGIARLTPANLARLRVPIPRGYPRSHPRS